MGHPERVSLPEPAEPACVGFALVARAAASALALASGFRAVSDDDYARIVIAERWVTGPRWDASGTSWLPAPFWVSGLAMKLAGRGIDVARATAIVIGLLAALLVYRAARWIGEPPGAAALGAAAASFSPWAARLGVATVPELPAAALTLLAAGSLAGVSPRRRLVGGAALLAATLSRYEAWPAAVVFIAFCAADARAASLRARLSLAGAAALAASGPVAWFSANRLTHGDALHFLARVAAYRHALGASTDGGIVRVLSYPRALVQEAPELVALLSIGAGLALFARVGWSRLRGYERPLLLVACQIAALSFAMMKDGAPTHHPERAMLTAMLLFAVLGVGLVARGATALPRERGAAAVVVAVTAFVVVGLASPTGDLAHRTDEAAIGVASARHLDPSRRALVEVSDYGFLAVQAAAGDPDLIVADRSIDPRDPPAPSSFDAESRLNARLVEARLAWVIARCSTVAGFTTLEQVEQAGAFGLYRTKVAP